MRLILSWILVGGCALSLSAQKYISEKSVVSFFSDASIEDIKAENTKSTSLLDMASQDIAFSIVIADFKFDKKLMQEHFNEKYLESEKYPKSTFAGKVVGFVPGTGGKQNVTVKGRLTIHGVTREVAVPGAMEVAGDKIVANAKFIVTLEDYNVPRPQLLWKNIAEQVEVTVSFTYKPYEK
ncbi:MAG: YceI family protein [Cyclobacteriaceae bacterium]|jgi:hypothetical protein|nr:YceI family protein [Cyclobacteriaceae bacterium]